MELVDGCDVFMVHGMCKFTTPPVDNTSTDLMSFNGPMSDISDSVHSLLEPPSPAYTNVTVRRAFIVWMYCGQRNKFKDVCNYYHHLEALEDQLPPEGRALSRHHEFNLFTNQPPTSAYLVDHFPQLYKETYVEKHNISKVEEIRNEKCVFKLEGFNEIAPKQGPSTHEIVEASRMIRKYCRIQMVSLKKFLEEFKQHARKCNLKYTVNNVAFYIKRKMVQAEIELEASYPKTLGFLNSVENISNDIQNTIKDDCTLKDRKAVSSCKEENPEINTNNIKNLRKSVEKCDDRATHSNNCNTFLGHTNIDVDKNIFLDDNTKMTSFKNPDTLIKDDTKYLSDDATDENIPIKKERRFSGSRFMKLESDKFRKI